MTNLVGHYIKLIPVSSQKWVQFTVNRPSRSWIDNFIKQHNLHYSGVRVVEGASIDAMTKEHVAEYLPRISALMKRCNIRDAME